MQKQTPLLSFAQSLLGCEKKWEIQGERSNDIYEGWDTSLQLQWTLFYVCQCFMAGDHNHCWQAKVIQKSVTISSDTSTVLVV